MRVAAMVGVLTCVGCQCGPAVVMDADAGIDAGVVPDSGMGGGSGDAGRVVLPLYRVGPRSAFQGMFGPALITATISLPVTANTPTSFSSWQVSSPVDFGQTTFSQTTDDGGTRTAGVLVSIATASSAPANAREIFTAKSADAGTVLLAVLDAQLELHFTIESTALQALAKHEVRTIETSLEEDYYDGVRLGDRPALDAQVAAVAAAMKLRLAADGTTGVSVNGFVHPNTALFDVIDSARASPGVMKPVVAAGASGLHVTEVQLGGQEGWLGVWIGGRTPQPVMAIPAGTTKVGLFFYTLTPGPEPLYVKFATADGGQSAASTRFALPEPLGTGPAEPTLGLDGGNATACGLTGGHHVVFFSTSTELAIGFAEGVSPAGGGCVTLPSNLIPSSVGLLNAAQVAPDGRVGAPSNIVFP